jgi:hypothetical protein
VSETTVVTTEQLSATIEALEDIFANTYEEFTSGDPKQKDYFQGKKDGVRVALSLVYELMGDKGNANHYKSMNRTTRYRRETVAGWIRTLVDYGEELVEALDEWAKEDSISKWHPVLLARNALRGRLYGASKYIERTESATESEAQT